jgi:hypothetical protein
MHRHPGEQHTDVRRDVEVEVTCFRRRELEIVVSPLPSCCAARRTTASSDGKVIPSFATARQVSTVESRMIRMISPGREL